jgi:hypothetical protein
LRKVKPRLYGILNVKLFKMEGCKETSRMDKCLDFEAFTKAVTELFNTVIGLRERSEKKTFEIWSSYLALTIVMLANGLRIREALRAAKRFYEYGERRFTIRAEKGGDNRLVIIPSFIEREDLSYVYKEVVKYGEKNVKDQIEKWLKRVFGVNPHSIRYAYIRYHSLGGSSIEQIAAALGLRERRNVKRYYLRGLKLNNEGEEYG